MVLIDALDAWLAKFGAVYIKAGPLASVSISCFFVCDLWLKFQK